MSLKASLSARNKGGQIVTVRFRCNFPPEDLERLKEALTGLLRRYCADKIEVGTSARRRAAKKATTKKARATKAAAKKTSRRR
jgi:hypothetical protein